MKQLKSDLEGVLKTLRLATEKTEKLIRKIENLSPLQPSTKSRVKSRTKTKPSVKKGSDTEKVLMMISRSRKGLTRAGLKQKTGFSSGKVGDILFRLKKRGLIKPEGNGVYVKA